MSTDLSRTVLFTWDVPGVDSASTRIEGTVGTHTTIVGANGSGKSSLGYWFGVNTSPPVARIIAHRKLWFPSAGPAITAADRGQSQANMDSWSRETSSRYTDNAEHQRTNIVLFDLLTAIHNHDAATAERVRAGESIEEVDADLGAPPLERLNSILAAADLPVQLSAQADQTFNVVNSNNGATYPIFQMSDGEKSALLLAGAVLVAPENAVQIIDEPERHLHRSISAGLISAILEQRSDCHFIVITHDLDLADTLTLRPGRTFSLTGAKWAAGSVIGWDLREVEADESVPDVARRAILGGRRNVIFIEGGEASLDAALYGILLPKWQLQPSGGADQVTRNVTGLRDSPSLHWVNAVGLVDGDARSEQERSALASKGVSVLEVSEVENLYFLPECIKSVAASQADGLGKDPAALSAAAIEAALGALKREGVLERLALKTAAGVVRHQAMESVPDRLTPDDEMVHIELPSPYKAILERLREASAAHDLEALVREVPIRDTALRSQVSHALGFVSVSDYESAVRVRLARDTDLAVAIRSRLGSIASHL
ncbi:AAA family ATPase [Curtobacterium flaccumfaciens pv. oortii]|uniref:AAA family ATPase n=1 Tax=Curtobacterium flaccumfaciens TaxID=2035 RepID=UPI001BDEF251|nr:AAA family ATPase [Curtobacterium flaccumfaciens]MBT1621178.1 AAA family ATPase [Curtobacterium flaccumfaciens pv. oortii]